MEEFERDTRDIVCRFVEGRINFIDCVHALDAALNLVVLTITAEQLPRLQEAMLANNESVIAVLREQSVALTA